MNGDISLVLSDFKILNGGQPIEFDRFKAESEDKAFTLTPQQWIKATDAIGIISKSGRYGGTYAHMDIALNLLLVFHRNLSCTLSKNISV